MPILNALAISLCDYWNAKTGEEKKNPLFHFSTYPPNGVDSLEKRMVLLHFPIEAFRDVNNFTFTVITRFPMRLSGSALLVCVVS